MEPTSSASTVLPTCDICKDQKPMLNFPQRERREDGSVKVRRCWACFTCQCCGAKQSVKGAFGQGVFLLSNVANMSATSAARPRPRRNLSIVSNASQEQEHVSPLHCMPHMCRMQEKARAGTFPAESDYVPGVCQCKTATQMCCVQQGTRRK